MIESLDHYNVPNKMKVTLASYLYDRKVYIDGCDSITCNIGVRQGSNVGPVLWLLIMNRPLDDFSNDTNVKVIAFADDILITLRATAFYHFKDLCNNSLRIVTNWSNKYCLCINYQKCNYTSIKRGKNITHFPSIKLNCSNIKYSNVLKYFGVLFDKNLSWNDYVCYVHDKHYKMFYKTKNISRATWGLAPKVIKQLYRLLYEKMVLYAFPIWYRNQVRIKRKLLHIQRLLLLDITKCYRTVAIYT